MKKKRPTEQDSRVLKKKNEMTALRCVEFKFESVSMKHQKMDLLD